MSYVVRIILVNVVFLNLYFYWVFYFCNFKSCYEENYYNMQEFFLCVKGKREEDWELKIGVIDSDECLVCRVKLEIREYLYFECVFS